LDLAVSTASGFDWPLHTRRIIGKLPSMKSSPIPFKKVPTLDDLKAGFPALKALFFDMDGTLFNTEGVHGDAMMMISTKFKIRSPLSPEAVHELVIGKADHFVFEIIKDWEGVPKHWTAQDFIEEKNKNLFELLKTVKQESYFLPEVSKLIHDAKKAGLFVALVTSSEKVVTQELLKITKLDYFFDLVLTRDDCPKHKPDPWPYFKALENAETETFETLIFEDSRVGLEAASLTGSHVIKVEWY
jgi:HAD superfamily hydrolase (TIGR01509 family)